MSTPVGLPNSGLLLSQSSDSNSFAGRALCTQKDDPLCLKTVFGNRCTECVSEHFLTHLATCEPIGQDFHIAFCESYGSSKNCNLCTQGYHLADNGGACRVNSIIPNCLVYQGGLARDGSVPNQTSCQKCAPGFDLLEGACIFGNVFQRIGGCARYDHLKSLCAECSQGLRLSDDGQLCSPFIQFCRLYHIQQRASNPGRSRNRSSQMCGVSPRLSPDGQLLFTLASHSGPLF